MIDLPHDHPAGYARSHDLSVFRFHDGGWIEELREAISPPALGTLGRYELLEETGRGGQGVVYRARDRQTNRIVAVKRLVAGALASSAMRHRFHREIEAAAALNHPNIVTLYGAEPVAGQPLLVMQWIDGVPINEWASRSPQPARREVLDVFARVADAVHHAHQRGVIHRDLKPSNILVDASGVPHVLDFGTAKLSSPADRAWATHSGQFLGTPAYCSPEQVRGRPADVDVRCDVYAMGVVLYEMLSGRLPYPVDGSLADVFDAIEHVQPPRLSRVDPEVSRDLDAIVMKALEKSPARRYQSVEALGADVRRSLRGEPVEARGAGTLYVLRKAIGRHRLPVAAGAVVALLLAGYAVSMPVLYARAQRQAQRAVKIQQFLEETLVAASPYRLGGDLQVSTILAEAVRRLDREFAGQPEAEAAIRFTIARAYGNLWMWPEAEPQARRAAGIYRSMGADDPAALVESLNLLGRAMAFCRNPAAVKVLEEALSLRPQLGSDHPLIAEAMTALAFASWHACDPRREREADARYLESLAMYRRLHTEPTPEWARAAFSYGMFKLNSGDHAGAEAAFDEALRMYERLGNETFYATRCLDGYARLLWETDRCAEAESMLLRSASMHPQGVATDQLAATWWMLGNVARRAGHHEQAQQRYRASLAMSCDVLAQRHEGSAPQLRAFAGRLREEVAGSYPYLDVISLLDVIDPPEAERWREAIGRL